MNENTHINNNGDGDKGKGKGKGSKYKTDNLVWANNNPAVVLPNNKLSYFNFKPRHVISPTTPPLIPFTSLTNFRTHYPSITDPALRNFTLQLWARHVVIDSLACKCLVPSKSEEFSGSLVEECFGVGKDLVGFLKGVSVGGWFSEDENDCGAVERVTFTARVFAVRRFFSKKQRGIYRLEKQQASRFTHSSSDAQGFKGYPEISYFKDKFKISNPLDEHLTASMISEKSLQPLHKDHLSFLPKTDIRLNNEQSVGYLLAYLRIIAANPFGLGGEEVKCFNTVKSSFLRFRNLSYQNASRHSSSNCSNGNEETHVSLFDLRGFTTPTQVADDVIKNTVCGKISSPKEPSKRTLVRYVSKRKFYQMDSFGQCSNLPKIASLSSCKYAESGLENAPRIKDHASFLRNDISLSHKKGLQLTMRLISDNKSATSINSNDGTTSFAWRSNLNENGELSCLRPPQALVKLQKRMQPEGLPALAYKTKILHMKFPRDFPSPSKEELVKVFSPFGPVDVSKTKVFTHLGSAQVAFLHDTDAAVAYQYAKRKKVLFGQMNVLFWLDPYENKRKGNGLVSSLSVKYPGLKSCLRSSNPLVKGVRKKPSRVRFLMETS